MNTARIRVLGLLLFFPGGAALASHALSVGATPTPAPVSAVPRGKAIPKVFGADSTSARGHAQDLTKSVRTVLDAAGYDKASRAFFGSGYGNVSLFDPPLRGRSFEGLSKDIDGLRGVEPRHKLALRFFLIGDSLDKDEWRALCGDSADAIRTQLGVLRMASEKDGKIRLDDLSVHSYHLAKGRPPGPMYLFTDLPQLLSRNKSEPTAQIASTSFALLQALENRKGDIKGVVADMGSGSGVQGIALARMHPGVTKVLGVEVVEHAENLSAMNAMLNGVETRFQVVHNVGNPDPLKGQPLSFVVTNPPFNIVPDEIANFPVFGKGGVDGLQYVRLFLTQTLPHLAPGGEVFLYGELGIDKEGRPLLEKDLAPGKLGLSKHNGVRVGYASPTLGGEKLGGYGTDALVDFLHSYAKGLPGGEKTPEAEKLGAAIAKAGITSIRPLLVTLQVSDVPVTFFPALPLERIIPRTGSEQLGGVYIQMVPAPRGLPRNAVDLIEAHRKEQGDAAVGEALATLRERYPDSFPTLAAELLRRDPLFYGPLLQPSPRRRRDE